jgi:hypothetical protein
MPETRFGSIDPRPRDGKLRAWSSALSKAGPIGGPARRRIAHDASVGTQCVTVPPAVTDMAPQQ